MLGASVSAGRVEAQDAETGRAAQPSMEAMRLIAKRVRLTATKVGGPMTPISLRPEPLLRYGDPAHNVLDGTLWAWGNRGRPASLLKVEDRRVKAGQNQWGMSITSLSTDLVALEYDGLTWESQGAGMEVRPLPDVPRPATSMAQRLTQAKTLVRRFSGSMTSPGAAGAVQLRLLPQPIDRYEDAASGLINGVIFTMAVTTNPTLYVILEARADASGATAWYYGLVRHGGAAMTARLDDHEVWTVPLVNSPENAKSYAHMSLWSRTARGR